MSDQETHPARSAEFLSRLHDGELDPAERARFEAHRADCFECREAAEQLEKTLAFFRSTRPRPAPPDLAARILQNLRSRSPRRPAFGHLLGIDLRWAGGLAAALVAVIVASSILVEREARDRRAIRDSAVSVVFQEPTAAPPAPEPKPAPSDSPPPARKKAAAPAKSPPARALQDRLRSNELDKLAGNSRRDPRGKFAPAPAAPPAPSTVAASRDEAAPRNAPAMSVEVEERTSALGRAEVAGGGDAHSTAAAAPAAQPKPPVRIRVIAPEGEEQAPEVTNALELALSPSDRGEYAVLVHSDGSVASVRRIEPNRQKVKAEGGEGHASGELRKLRFPASGRARELIVRIE